MGVDLRVQKPQTVWSIQTGQSVQLHKEYTVTNTHDVDHPDHYTSHPAGIECIQVTEHMNFCRGNAIKYIWRAGSKDNEVQDLLKARWYITRELKRLGYDEDADDTDDGADETDDAAEQLLSGAMSACTVPVHVLPNDDATLDEKCDWLEWFDQGRENGEEDGYIDGKLYEKFDLSVMADDAVGPLRDKTTGSTYGYIYGYILAYADGLREYFNDYLTGQYKYAPENVESKLPDVNTLRHAYESTVNEIISGTGSDTYTHTYTDADDDDDDYISSFWDWVSEWDCGCNCDQDCDCNEGTVIDDIDDDDTDGTTTCSGYVTTWHKPGGPCQCRCCKRGECQCNGTLVCSCEQCKRWREYGYIYDDFDNLSYDCYSADYPCGSADCDVCNKGVDIDEP